MSATSTNKQNLIKILQGVSSLHVRNFACQSVPASFLGGVLPVLYSQGS